MADIIVRKGLEKDLPKVVSRGTIAEPIFTTDTERLYLTNGNKLVEIGATDPDVMEHIKSLQSGKVDKVSGKGLSTNDYTTPEKTKLAGISTGANNYVHPSTHPASIITEEANKRFMTDAERTKLQGIDTSADVNQNAFSNVKVGATNISADTVTDTLEIVAGKNITLTPDASTDKITIESKDTIYVHPESHAASMIVESDTRKFMTNAEKTKLAGIANGANNYTHPANHPATMITQDATHRFMTDAERTKLQGISAGAGSNQNAFSNVKVGGTTIVADTITDTLEIVAGSNVTITADATTDKITIASKDTVYTHPANHPATIITQTDTHRFVTNAQMAEWNGKATTSYVDTKVSQLVDSAPGTLDTLKELATALGNDANFATTVSTQIGQKVDKVSGKGLSTNDYTSAEKTKLSGIATGANNYVHPVDHPASMVKFTDGENLQAKLDGGSLGGTEVPLIHYEKTLVIGSDWTDAGISGTDIPTGSYIVQVSGFDSTATTLWTELFTGFMSWYSGSTDSTESDEILLHGAGHSPNGQNIYLRTVRVVNGTMKLQISANRATASTPVHFKFKKLI